MFVANAREVIDAVLRYEQRDGDGFDSGVAPAVIVDATFPVNIVDVITVLRRPPDVEVRDLEVVPEHDSGRHPELASDCMLALVFIDGRPEPNLSLIHI